VKNQRKKPHDGPKVIALDIETAPCIAYVWRTGKQMVTIDQIQQQATIISFSWAEWEFGKVKKARYESTFEQANQRDDRKLVTRLHEILKDATHVAAHNGAGFDWPMINGAFYRCGLKPLPKPKILDTALMARQIGGQASYKLAWLTKDQKTAKRAHQRFPGLELWIEWLARNPAAEREMRLYNNADVEAMCELLNNVLPWARGPQFAGLVAQSVGREDEVHHCPRCGSQDVVPRGFATTVSGRYQRYRCGSCGGWSQSRFLVREKRRHLLKTI